MSQQQVGTIIGHLGGIDLVQTLGINDLPALHQFRGNLDPERPGQAIQVLMEDPAHLLLTRLVHQIWSSWASTNSRPAKVECLASK